MTVKGKKCQRGKDAVGRKLSSSFMMNFKLKDSRADDIELQAFIFNRTVSSHMGNTVWHILGEHGSSIFLNISQWY